MSESDSADSRSKSKSTTIPRFHGRRGGDYGLWRLRLRAACRIRGVWNIFESISDKSGDSESTKISEVENEKVKENMETASGMVIAALGNTPLRVVADVDDEPAKMLELLDARQLEFMGKCVAIPDSHKAPMLLASIDPDSEMEPIAAALRTKDADDLTWNYVATTLIDEYNSQHKFSNGSNRTKSQEKQGKEKLRGLESSLEANAFNNDIGAVTKALATAIENFKSVPKGKKASLCKFCNRVGHTESNCFLNPDNPNNKLSAKLKERLMISQENKSKNNKAYRRDENAKSSRLEFAGLLGENDWHGVAYTIVSAPQDLKTYYDSGATSHVFHEHSAFIPGTLVDCDPRKILLADKSFVSVTKKGDVKISFKVSDLLLKDVLLVPGLGFNLVSVGRLADGGIESVFDADGVILKHKASETVLGSGTRDRSTMLYALPDPVLFRNALLAVASSADSLLWHRRLAHLNFRDLSGLHEHVLDVPKLEQTKNICHPCQLGKAHKLPFHGKFNRAEQIGDIIHSDIVGPLEPSYPDRFRYFATFVDDYSRYTFVGMVKRRSDLNNIFKMFVERFSRVKNDRSGILQTGNMASGTKISTLPSKDFIPIMLSSTSVSGKS